ncbi:MAG: GAF domain-containing protein [Caldilineaceae bacterium]
MSLLVAVGALTWLVWSLRRFIAPEGPSLLLTAATIFVWSGSHALSIFLIDPRSKLLFLKLQLYVGLLMPVVTAYTTLLYTRQPPRLRRWVNLLQLVIFVVLVGLMITNEQHRLMIKQFDWQVYGGVSMWVADRGPLLSGFLVYIFVVIAIEGLLLLQFLGIPYLSSLRRSLPILLGVIAPLFTYFYALSNATSIRPISLAILTAFLIACFVITWIILTLRDVTPMAKSQVFDSMTQAVLVLDKKLRIADLNRMAELLIKRPINQLRDRNMYELRDHWPQLVQFCLNLPNDQVGNQPLQELLGEEIVSEVAYWGGWQQRFFEARSTRIVNHRNQAAGWAIVLTDITEQKRNTRILADEKNRLQLLYTLSQELYGLLSLYDAATKAVEITVAALRLYMGELSILGKDGESLRVVAVSNQSQAKVDEINRVLKLHVGRGLSGTAASERNITIWTQLGRDQKWYEAVGIDVSVRSGAAIPLISGERLLGVLTLLSDDQEGIRESDRQLFATIALPTAMAIQNALRFEEAQQRSEFFEELTHLSNALRQVHNHNQVVETLLNHSIQYFGAEAADIVLPSEDGQYLVSTDYRGGSKPAEILPIPIHESLLGHIFLSGQGYYSPDILRDPLSYPPNKQILQEALDDAPVITAIHAPLRAEEKVIGVMLLLSGKTNAFQADDLQMLSAFAEIGGHAMWRAQILETLEQRVEERTRELADANKQLSELDQLKNEFIASVNHELRTPLTNIKLYLSLLAEGKEERRPKYMEVLNRETSHLTRLLESSFDITQLEKARVNGTQQHTIFDIRAIITVMANKYSGRIQSKGLDFRVDAPDETVLINGNQVQIEQAISNLLDNALEYTDKGYIAIEICAEEDVVRIRVSDSGYGIPEHEQPRIWKRFYRGQRVRGLTHSGYGLGLSIVKEIVDLHHGRVLVQSKENAGSLFEVILPIAKVKTSNGVPIERVKMR